MSEKRIRRPYHNCAAHLPGCPVHDHPENPEACVCFSGASSESRVSAVTDAALEAATSAGLGAQIPGPHIADPVCSKGPGEPISGTCYLHVDQMRFLARVMLEAAAKVKQPVCLSVRSKVPAPVSDSSSRAEGHTSTAPPLPSDKAVTSFALDRVKLDAENNAELARCLEERYGDRNGCCCSWDFARGYAAAIRFVRVHTEPGKQPSDAAAVAAFDAYLEAYEVPPHVMPRVPNAQDLAKMRAALSAAYAVDAPNARPAVSAENANMVIPMNEAERIEYLNSEAVKIGEERDRLNRWKGWARGYAEGRVDAVNTGAQRANPFATPAVSGDAAEADALVAEIRARADAATPGPWVDRDEGIFAAVVRGPNKVIICHDHSTARDAYFIAASRTDVPWLCDRIEDLQRRLAASEKRVAELSAIEEWAKAVRDELCHVKGEHGEWYHAKGSTIELIERILTGSADAG